MSIVTTMIGTTGASYFAYSDALFNVPGTYTWICPPFVSNVNVMCIGGGGAGGVGWGGYNGYNGGAGGGGGGCGWKNNVQVRPGNTYLVVVGSGGNAANGTGGPIQYDPSTDGSNSYFISSTLVQGNGGKSAAGNVGGVRGGFVGDGGGNGEP